MMNVKYWILLLFVYAAVLHAQTGTAEKSIPQQHAFQELERKFFSTRPDTALNHYITDLKSAQEKGDKRQVALAHIGIALLNSYIGKQAETARIFRYYLYDTDDMNDQERDFLRLGLANAYIETRKMDSAYILIREGLQTSERGSYQYHEYLGLQGFYDLQLKKYPSAAHSLSECRKFFFIPENAAKRNQNYTLWHLGRSYAGLDETEKAVECFTTIDSLVVKTGYLYPELKDAYTYLIRYYKEKKDQGKQLYYMERFMEVDRMLDFQIRAILKELPGKYSISYVCLII